MVLSRKTLLSIQPDSQLQVPGEALYVLPERVLQFGTGVLLRGLPDYFIDCANRKAVFNGRIVVVKSTGKGDIDDFDKQDNLFTHCIRGIENDKEININIINSAISRVLSANQHWHKILACAANPQLQVIISNTTEVGISLLDNDNIAASPPVSFPGKLLAFLIERFKQFNGSKESGMVIIPTELIVENGKKLKEIILELGRQNKVEQQILDWIINCNDFCNSLVDRIVPGQLMETDKIETAQRLGYSDNLMIVSEVYSRWAIETSHKRTRDILSFSIEEPGVVIAEDIEKFRELKLRLLNGSHTFCCALAILLGFTTVKQAMDNGDFLEFISGLMENEIVPVVENESISFDEGHGFALQVLDRYKNPFIEHKWLSISLQYTSKMRMRNVPTILKYYEKFGSVAAHMALGFAAYILFMKSSENERGEYIGTGVGVQFVIQDDKADQLYLHWKQAASEDEVVQNILSDISLWGTDLSLLNGFATAVTGYLKTIKNDNSWSVIKKIRVQK